MHCYRLVGRTCSTAVLTPLQATIQGLAVVQEVRQSSTCSHIPSRMLSDLSSTCTNVLRAAIPACTKSVQSCNADDPSGPRHAQQPCATPRATLCVWYPSTQPALCPMEPVRCASKVRCHYALSLCHCQQAYVHVHDGVHGFLLNVPSWLHSRRAPC